MPGELFCTAPPSSCSPAPVRVSWARAVCFSYPAFFLGETIEKINKQMKFPKLNYFSPGRVRCRWSSTNTAEWEIASPSMDGEIGVKCDNLSDRPEVRTQALVIAVILKSRNAQVFSKIMLMVSNRFQFFPGYFSRTLRVEYINACLNETKMVN